MSKGFDKFIGLYTDKSVPGWIRGITWLVTIGVVFYAGRTIYVILFPAKPSGELATVNNDIAKFATTQTPSFAESAYNQYADAIYNAYDPYVGALSNGATVMDTLMLMKNDLDVAKLIKAYGTRGATVLGYGTGTSYSLFTAAKNAMSGDNFGMYDTFIYSRIDTVNNDWKAKGITYKL